MKRPTARPVTRANASGGSAAAGGMNFHARVAAVAAVHLLVQRPLEWLEVFALDTPIAVWCETNGPGDDLRIDLANDVVVEAQVKKGLQRGDDLWKALLGLANGIHTQLIAYGVLIVDIDASGTIRSDLATGITRLGQGRTDSLHEITSDFKLRLEDAGMPVQSTCQKLRIVVMHCADHDDASEAAAKSALARICATGRDVISAWQALEVSAHKRIELRGRWTAELLNSILKAAGVEFNAAAREASPAWFSGCAWEHLGSVSPYRGFITNFRQHYLAPVQMSAQAFGGRDAEFKRLDTWLFDADAPNRMLISGPTARGKSALLVHWTEGLKSDAAWSVVFVPISLRFGTDQPEVFYALLASQLASLLKEKLVSQTSDLKGYYQGIASDLLSEAGQQARYVLVVVDGLDEAQGSGFSPTVFPLVLPANIKVLVSARQQAGDHGCEGWLKRLDWQGRGMAAAENLAILNREAVVPILESVGLTKQAQTAVLIDRLMVLSAGEPLLLALYAEDLKGVEEKGETPDVQILEGITPGFSAYFSRVFDAQLQTLEAGEQETIDTTLAVLAMALGPIEGTHLTDLVCELHGLRRPAASDRFVKPLKRWITGDGSTEHGFVLNHPKFGEYLREERFDPRMQDEVSQTFLGWGRSVATGLASNPNTLAPTYVLRHHVSYLSQSAPISLSDIELLLSAGWMEAWVRLDINCVGYADSLLVASGAMNSCADYGEEAIRALRLKLRIGLSVGSVRSLGVRIPSELLAMALQEKLITLRQALTVADSQTPENRPGYLVALAENLPPSEFDTLIADIHRMESAENRLHLLARLARHLRGQQREQIVGHVLTLLQSTVCALWRISVTAELVPALDDAQLDNVLSQIMSTEWTGEFASSAVQVLAPTIGFLRERNKNELADRLIDQCFRWTEIAADPLFAVAVWGSLAAVATDRVQSLTAALSPAIQAMQPPLIEGVMGDEKSKFRREQFTYALVTLDLLALHRMPTESYEAEMRIALKPLLTPGDMTFGWLATVLPMIRPYAHHEVLRLVHEFVLKETDASNRLQALMALSRAAAGPLRKSLIAQALVDVRRIGNDGVYALLSLFNALSASHHEHEFAAVLADINKIDNWLAYGETLLDVATSATEAEALAEMGLNAIQRFREPRLRSVALLRNIEKFPPHQRRAVVQKCWEECWDYSKTGTGVRFEFPVGPIAFYAADYWTAHELGIARSELVRSHCLRLYVLTDLLPIATRLGQHDLVDEALKQISAEADPNEALSCMVRAMKVLPLRDSRRDLLRQKWWLAVVSSEPRTDRLIVGFEALDAEQQSAAWTTLKDRAKLLPMSGRSLARLSVIAKTDSERVELLGAAFVACAAAKAVDRMAAAAEIVAMCRNDDERFRAFDLMTAAPAVTRDTVLGAIKIAAATIAEVGGAPLLRALMSDIREIAIWWP